MIKLAHIINPVIVDSLSDLYRAQPVTFESMRIAKEMGQQHNIDVGLYSAQYIEDRGLVPDFFQLTPNLERSVIDFGDFKHDRKLPIIGDILERVYKAAPQADYIIYSNVDIALMPNFYISISKIIEQGFDAFTINRRTIQNNIEGLDIYRLYAEVGKIHPGTDCFVFKREVSNHYYLDSACIGTLNIAKSLLINMIIHAKKYKQFTDLHLTFHIGDDRAWSSNKYADYIQHNKDVVKRILEHYYQSGSLPNHPLLEKYLKIFCEKIWKSQHTKLAVLFYGIIKVLRFIYRKLKYLYTRITERL